MEFILYFNLVSNFYFSSLALRLTDLGLLFVLDLLALSL